jgi:hypothetical protein
VPLPQAHETPHQYPANLSVSHCNAAFVLPSWRQEVAEIKREQQRQTLAEAEPPAVARLVAEVTASRGITKCKPVYAVLSPQYRV